jgi:glycosyltransferase involved in cell wall biosynthesis
MFPETNRQRVMSLLAQKHNVLYVEQPKYIHFQLVKSILRIKPEQRSWKWFRRVFSPENRQENLNIFSLVRFLPLKRRSWRHLTYKLGTPFVKRAMKKLRFEKPIAWIYTPDAVAVLDQMNPLLVIYDCVDDYAEQPWYADNFWGIREDEIFLAKRADIIFTTSSALYEKKKKINKNTYFVGNPGDYDHFSKAMLSETPVPDEISRIPKPIIGFIGAIDEYKLDISILIGVAESHPEWSVVLIGPTGVAGRSIDIEKLKIYSNVFLLGPRHYARLPEYLKAFDVCMIPYQLNEYTRSCFPLKFFEYMASGRPIVVSGLPSLREFGEHIWMANSIESFIQGIEVALHQDSKERQIQRMAIASENTWEGKVSQMIEIIQKTRDGFSLS